MRWKPWLPVLLSLVAFSCASSREPVMTLVMDSSFMGVKKHIEMRDRRYTVTLVVVRPGGDPATSQRQGVLPKETYAEALRLLDGIRLAELKDSYAEKRLSIGNVVTTLVSITYKGQKKGVFLLGDKAAPKELAPLLDLIMPLMYT